MVERDFLIRRRFISGEDTADDVSPGGGAADVRQLLVPERFNDVVEVRGRGYRIKSTEQNRPVFVEKRVQPRPLLLHGRCQSGRRGNMS